MDDIRGNEEAIDILFDITDNNNDGFIEPMENIEESYDLEIYPNDSYQKITELKIPDMINKQLINSGIYGMQIPCLGTSGVLYPYTNCASLGQVDIANPDNKIYKNINIYRIFYHAINNENIRNLIMFDNSVDNNQEGAESRIFREVYRKIKQSDGNVFHLTVVDYNAPSIDILEEFLYICDDYLGNKLCHCTAGWGRTGRMLLIYTINNILNQMIDNNIDEIYLQGFYYNLEHLFDGIQNAERDKGLLIYLARLLSYNYSTESFKEVVEDKSLHLLIQTFINYSKTDQFINLIERYNENNSIN